MKKLKHAVLVKRANRKGDRIYYIRSTWEDSETGEITRNEKSTGLPSDKRGSRRQNQDLAELELQKFKSKYGSDAEQIFVHDFCDRWMNNQIGLEKSTLEGYSYRISRIKNYFSEKNILLSDLTIQDVSDFYNHLLTVEQGVGKEKRIGYSTQTISDTAKMLNMVLNDAVKAGLIPQNVAESVTPAKQVNRSVREESKDVILTDSQLPCFMEAIKGHPLEELFFFTLFYGMRREEVVALKWDSIRDGKINIENTITHTKTIIEKERTKNSASNRKYPIPSEIARRLEIIKERQQNNKIVYGDTYIDSGYIFTHENGRGYRPDYVTKSFKKLVLATDGLDDRLTLHSLRKSCVSILANNNTPIKFAQEWVGHSDIKTTAKYYWKTDAEKNKEATAKALTDSLLPA